MIIEPIEIRLMLVSATEYERQAEEVDRLGLELDQDAYVIEALEHELQTARDKVADLQRLLNAANETISTLLDTAGSWRSAVQRMSGANYGSTMGTGSRSGVGAFGCSPDVDNGGWN